MKRCLHLASLGAGKVAPNPMVGAVLVYEDRIIGEGWHQKYGGPHAEVNCVNSVSPEHQPLISQSTIYVSLEPCAHFGKTPPCADLIISRKIPRVIIGCRDPFEQVDGKGIEKLEQAGIAVISGVLENECKELNRRFLTFHRRHRPYIILKWAQSSDGLMAAAGNERTFITNEYSNRLVHKWRSEEAAIVVGTSTALRDDPSLTNRLWSGNNPVRVVLDMDLRLPGSLRLFDAAVRTIVFNASKDGMQGNIEFVKVSKAADVPMQVVKALYKMNVQSILVEGGAQLLQSFIGQQLFDEIRVIENTALHLGKGLQAPRFSAIILKEQLKLMDDDIKIFIQHP